MVESIGVFIQATFPGGILVGKKESSIEVFGNCSRGCELLAVIRDQLVNLMSDRFEQPKNGSGDVADRFSLVLVVESQSEFTLDQ